MVETLLIGSQVLEAAQMDNDVALAQEFLQDAYRTDVRPLVAEASVRAGGALKPVELFRQLKVRDQLVAERGELTIATGL